MSSSIEKVLLDKNLIKILVCPITKSKLLYDKINNRLISKDAGLVFPIVNGVPVLIIEEAKKFKEDIF